jgi:hypothetical protein
VKTVYVAGPFRSKKDEHGQINQWNQNQNIQNAARIALQLWKYGFAVICPHLNTAPFQGALPDAVWLRGDLELLLGCAYIVMTPDWRDSQGARAEFDFASERGIRRFEWDDDINDAFEIDSAGEWKIGEWLSTLV